MTNSLFLYTTKDLSLPLLNSLTFLITRRFQPLVRYFSLYLSAVCTQWASHRDAEATATLLLVKLTNSKLDYFGYRLVMTIYFLPSLRAEGVAIQNKKPKYLFVFI